MLTYPDYFLRLGSEGEYVQQVQRCLNNLSVNNLSANYSTIPILNEDGNFGPETEKAVKSFQNIFSLKEDGIVGPITWDLLSSECEKNDTLDFNVLPQIQDMPQEISTKEASPITEQEQEHYMENWEVFNNFGYPTENAKTLSNYNSIFRLIVLSVTIRAITAK